MVVRLGLTEEEQNHYWALRKIKRDLVREEREAELWQKRDQHEIARRKFSFEFYSELLKKGYGQLVVLYLAHHPEELAHVWELLAGKEQIDRKHWLGAFKSLKELDTFEEPHLQEARNFVIQHFTEREKQARDQRLEWITTEALTALYQQLNRAPNMEVVCLSNAIHGVPRLSRSFMHGLAILPRLWRGGANTFHSFLLGTPMPPIVASHPACATPARPRLTSLDCATDRSRVSSRTSRVQRLQGVQRS